MNQTSAIEALNRLVAMIDAGEMCGTCGRTNASDCPRSGECEFEGSQREQGEHHATAPTPPETVPR